MTTKYLIAILVTFIFIAGLATALLLVRQRQEIRKRASGPTDVLVSLSPPSQTIAKGQKATISVLLTNTSAPGRNINLYSAEVYLTFDPAYFSISNLSCNGSFLSSPAVSSASGNSISLACFAPGGTGTRTVASGTQSTLGSFDITTSNKEGASQISFSKVNVPDGVTFADLSGAGGTGGTYTITAGGGPPDLTNCRGNVNAPPKCFDCNGDGVINILDFSCFAKNYGKNVPPEP